MKATRTSRKATPPVAPPPVATPPKRTQFFLELEAMPDEAFGWILIAIASRIFPAGLGGFTEASRKSIVAVKSEAAKLMELMGGVLVVLLVSSSAFAQPSTVTNPRSIDFVASADHAVTVDGAPVVASYTLDVMVMNATVGPIAFSKGLGKPTPGAGNVIAVVIPEFLTMGNGKYVAKVTAVGPGGAGASPLSDPFSRIGPPAGPAKPTITP